MSSSVNDIWDDDVVEEVSKRHKTSVVDSDDDDSPRPTKRPRQTLFLPASDDEDSGNESNKTRQGAAGPDKDLDIDAMFGDIDDMDDDIASRPLKTLNADELERQLQAERRAAQPLLTPHEILSSSPVKESARGGRKGKDDDGEKKERRKPVHLNENLLVGENGFPRLMKSIKDFKPKGKGHEASDLSRLLGVYQFWTHSLYPKTQFRDTVTRIEKLCHSKRMQVRLSVWRDEFKGVAHEPGSDSDNENENEDEIMDAEPSVELSRQQSTAPSNVSYHSSSPPPPPTSRPPSAASEHDDIFDDDFEALLQQAGSETTSMSVSNSKSTAATTVDDEEVFWADMDMAGEMGQVPPQVVSKPNDAMDEDDDMWDIIDQANKESAMTSAKAIHTTSGEIPQPSPPRPPPEPQHADPSDWDDMYV